MLSIPVQSNSRRSEVTFKETTERKKKPLNYKIELIIYLSSVLTVGNQSGSHNELI